jgi:hypothetical protein
MENPGAGAFRAGISPRFTIPMRLTPSQRIHAICAFVVPIVLVLMFAPWPPDRSDTGQRSSAGRCADDQAPPHCEVSSRLP